MTHGHFLCAELILTHGHFCVYIYFNYIGNVYSSGEKSESPGNTEIRYSADGIMKKVIDISRSAESS